MPFYPSPLRDDGYDISSYRGINPAYGSLRDFKRFEREAHERGLRVITELVINHTSDQHPWFQRARAAKPGSAARNARAISQPRFFQAAPLAASRVTARTGRPASNSARATTICDC